MKKRILLPLALLLAIGLVVAGCPSPQVAETPAEEKIRVIVSILPLADFVENVGGERVAVTVMVPPGVSYHVFSPTPGWMRAVSRAKMFVKVGSGVEFELVGMDKIRALNKEMLIVDSSVGIELMGMEEPCPCCPKDQEHKDKQHHEGKDHEKEHHHHGGQDPHIWLSPLNARIMVQNILSGLIKIDPEYADFYTENAEMYLQELHDLDQYIRERLKGFQNRHFLIYHPAFGYFARDHNLTQLAIEHEGKEPTPRVIMESIRLAKKHNLSYVFVDLTFPMMIRRAEVIAAEINGQTALIDGIPRYFIPSMRNLVDLLAREMME